MIRKVRTKKKSVLASADPTELISLTEASQRFGISPTYLRTIARTGRLWAKKVGRDWLTSSSAIEEYIRSREKKGLYREDLEA